MTTTNLPQTRGTLAQPPSTFEKLNDRGFRTLTRLFALAVVLMLVFLVYEITRTAWPALITYGPGFLIGSDWSVAEARFGIWPQIAGTLVSSLLALAMGTLFGVTVAIVLSQSFLPPKLEWLLTNLVQLLAAIPSVVFGLWGLFVIVPLVRPIANSLNETMGWFPLFSTRLSGPGMFPAALVLAIMILPTIASISRDALASVPQRLKEAAYGIGATRWQAILQIIVPTAAPGIFGAIVLGFGRAVGETMAVAMLIGNANTIQWSLFAPGTTLAALLANKFAEADPVVEIPALMAAALVLLVITLVINVVGVLILQRASRSLKGIH